MTKTLTTLGAPISDCSNGKSSATGTITTDQSNDMKPYRKRRVIDESALSTEDAERLDTRRRHNRESAARARKRTKESFEELHQMVASLKGVELLLRRENISLKKESLSLATENHELRAQVAILTKLCGGSIPTQAAARSIIDHHNPKLQQKLFVLPPAVINDVDASSSMPMLLAGRHATLQQEVRNSNKNDLLVGLLANTGVVGVVPNTSSGSVSMEKMDALVQILGKYP